MHELMFKGIGLSLGVLLLLLMVGLGEAGWLMFVGLWMVLLVSRLFPRWPLVIPAVIGVTILALHAGGYKLYGSPKLRDNRPLIENAWVLDHLEAPNVLVATDGSRHPLPGITFLAGLERMPAYEQAQIFDRRGEPLRFAKAGDLPSGYAVERRIGYWCGNTWFPYFFPRRLPSYERVDIISALRYFVSDPKRSAAKP
jgi:hypothetical protein